MFLGEVLLLGGVLLVLASWIIRWVLIVGAVVLVAVGLYVLSGGSLGAL